MADRESGFYKLTCRESGAEVIGQYLCLVGMWILNNNPGAFRESVLLTEFEIGDRIERKGDADAEEMHRMR